MRVLICLVSLAALAACNEPAAEAEPVEAEVAAPEPVEPALPAPTKASFSELLAVSCPALKPVANASCRSMGMGAKEFLCEYGLGDDEYLRHKATLTPGDGAWTLADPETVCAQGA
jgi:hypothetical protein